MIFEAQFQKAYSMFCLIGNLGLRLLWHCLHFIVSLWCFVLHVADVVESYLISAGIFKHYQDLNIQKLHYLAIVVESEDAHQISKIVQLLQWLADVGVRRVCLYDREGILKMSKGSILDKLKNVKLFEDVDENESLMGQQLMTLEFASFSDGKEGLAKAANLLFKEYLKLGGLNKDQELQIFTESHLTEALRAVGFKGPEPDLLLVYGPARCHLGFPAWRIRYTEIVHMGPLTSIKYGLLTKAIYKFTMVRQNYACPAGNQCEPLEWYSYNKIGVKVLEQLESWAAIIGLVRGPLNLC